MPTLARFEVSGLFGHLSHEVNFRSHEPTLLAGPNGTGKTHILSIIKSAVELNAGRLMGLPFERAALVFSSGGRMEVARVRDGDKAHNIEISYRSTGDDISETVTITEDDVREEHENVPDRFQRISATRWIDPHF